MPPTLPSTIGLAPGWRRLCAFIIDYLLVIVPFLGLQIGLGWLLVSQQITLFTPEQPWLNQSIVLLSLTLPIAGYFAVCETSPWQATLGKRVLGLAVVNLHGQRISIKQSVLRVLGKFLPWEYFHALLWHWPGWPTHPSDPTGLQWFGMGVGWIMVLWYTTSLFLASGRTPYDWLAQTVVIQITKTSPAINEADRIRRS